MTPLKEQIIKDFNAEFGIHFKDSAGELQFANEFILDALDRQLEEIRKEMPEELKIDKDACSIDADYLKGKKDGWNDLLSKIKEILK